MLVKQDTLQVVDPQPQQLPEQEATEILEIPQESVVEQPADTQATAQKPLTTYEMLRRLPKDATPAQQDSALDAHFNFDQPFTLPSDSLDRAEQKDSASHELPLYYKENFFSSNPLLHPELNGGRYGVAGDPVPYTIRGDNMITSLLLGSFILALISFAGSRFFFLRELKALFYPRKSTDDAISETSNEVRFQSFLVVLTALLLSILYYFYTRAYVGDTFIVDNQLALIGIFFGIIVAYFLVKTLLYTAVNWVFFGMKKNGQWLRSQLFVTSLEGVLLFPLVMLQVYFNMSLENGIIIFAVILVLVKILTFYKCFLIFFRQIGVFLQIILYFCALEIVPLLALWATLVLTSNLLKVNY